MLPLPVIALFALGAFQPSQRSLAIEHATVVPMTRDTVLLDHTVLVAGGRITWLGPAAGARIPVGAERLDATGLHLIPGLADMHVHLERADFARYLDAGITTVRNMRGRPDHLAWRNSVNRGTLTGPRIYTAGPGLGRGLFGNREFVRLRTTADAEQAVRAQDAAGYDMLKVFNRIEPDVFTHL